MNDRCYACMSPLEGGVCQHCGYDNNSPFRYDGTLLQPGRLIKSRYLVGLPLSRNGEGVTYIGYDVLNNCKISIREFFPDTLCDRAKDGSIAIKFGVEITFQALMADFVELHRQLLSLSAGGAIARVVDVLSDNKTVYAISEATEGINLEEFLIKNGGEISWEEIEPLFMPLLYAVKLLSANGIVHRGISPKNIIVTPSQEFKLVGFCTSAARALNTEINAELFSSYSAPEQYNRCASHGEWTDIYSVSAVLFRILTGTAPERADMRDPAVDIISPRKINVKIPYGVSQAIVKGMAYDKTERLSSAREFIASLYATPPARSIDTHATAVPQPLKKKAHIRMPVWLIVILITLPVLLVIFVVLYSTVLGGLNEPANNTNSDIPVTSSSEPSSETSSIISSEPSSEPSSSDDTSSATVNVTVNNFVGKYYEDIIATELYLEWFKFKIKEEYDETATIGEVIAQSIEQNAIVEQGTEIELTVSIGQQTVIIPPYTDAGGNEIPLSDYTEYFSSKGVQVIIEYVDDLEEQSGKIVTTSPAAGGFLDREQSNQITVYVAR